MLEHFAKAAVVLKSVSAADFPQAPVVVEGPAPVVVEGAAAFASASHLAPVQAPVRFAVEDVSAAE